LLGPHKRVDGSRFAFGSTRAWALPACVVLAAVFVLIGATELDLGEMESRVGLAAGEALGPLGQ
jgi:hypothetical protein